MCESVRKRGCVYLIYPSFYSGIEYFLNCCRRVTSRWCLGFLGAGVTRGFCRHTISYWHVYHGMPVIGRLWCPIGMQCAEVKPSVNIMLKVTSERVRTGAGVPLAVTVTGSLYSFNKC